MGSRVYDSGGGDITSLVEAVLDLATASMDFGSGFLDDEQVIALRRLARAVGRDPKTATPAQWDQTTHIKSGAVRVESEHACQRVYKPTTPPMEAVMCLCGWVGPWREHPTYQTTEDESFLNWRQSLPPDSTPTPKELYGQQMAQLRAQLAEDADNHIQQMLEAAREGR